MKSSCLVALLSLMFALQAAAAPQAASGSDDKSLSSSNPPKANTGDTEPIDPSSKAKGGDAGTDTSSSEPGGEDAKSGTSSSKTSDGPTNVDSKSSDGKPTSSSGVKLQLDGQEVNVEDVLDALVPGAEAVPLPRDEVLALVSAMVGKDKVTVGGKSVSADKVMEGLRSKGNSTVEMPREAVLALAAGMVGLVPVADPSSLPPGSDGPSSGSDKSETSSDSKTAGSTTSDETKAT